MNESHFSSSASLPPIPSPDDHRRLEPTGSSGSALVLGNFLGYGFVGHIVFTILQLNIANSTSGHAEAGASMDKQLALLVIPMACAIAGGVTARRQGLPWLGHSLAIGVIMLAGVILGLLNLFVWALTGMAGYC